MTTERIEERKARITAGVYNPRLLYIAIVPGTDKELSLEECQMLLLEARLERIQRVLGTLS